MVCRQRRIDLSAVRSLGQGCSYQVDRFERCHPPVFRNGLSRLTWIAPIPSPAKAPELSATVIGTRVGSTTVGPPRKLVAVARFWSVRTVRKLQPSSPACSNGESGVVTFFDWRSNQASGSGLEPATRFRPVDARLLHGLADDLQNNGLRDDARFRMWPGPGRPMGKIALR